MAKQSKKTSKRSKKQSNRKSLAAVSAEAVPAKPLKPQASRFRSDPEPDGQMLRHASVAFAIAGAVAILMLMVAVAVPSGREAISAIGGTVSGTVSERPARWALLLDTLFPIFYGSGFVLLFSAFRSRSNRALLRLVLTAVLIGVVADFAENALVFGVMSGGEDPMIRFPLTVIKYATLAFALTAASGFLTGSGALATLVRILLRYAMPVVVAFLISGIGGELTRSIAALAFAGGVILLAIYAGSKANSLT